jgi:anti-sigma-K factor RskA
VTVSSAAVDPATTKAVAVSVEPASGSSAPTTTPIIVAALE